MTEQMQEKKYIFSPLPLCQSELALCSGCLLLQPLFSKKIVYYPANARKKFIFFYYFINLDKSRIKS